MMTNKAISKEFKLQKHHEINDCHWMLGLQIGQSRIIVSSKRIRAPMGNKKLKVWFIENLRRALTSLVKKRAL